MVAVVSGNGLGLLGGSAGVLGSGGQTGTAGLGQAGEGAWINAKTGNLLLQRQDELLAGRGPDIGVVRTYNSQGGFDFDNGDSWQLSLYRKLASLTGTVNTAGSTIKRFEADGSQLTYTYDAALGKYVNRDGSGAYDTLSYDSTGNTWTWRDGDTGLTETFGASPTAGEWRITSVADRDGNTLTYGYDSTSGLITQVTTANGETTLLQYNASRQLTRIDIVTAGNVTTTRVRYEYDSNTPSRLTKVITDLTPQDGSVADNNTFVTTYTYHSTTTRVASITHGDGTQLSFTYDGSGRVQTYTDGSGAVTTLTYNSGNTTVTDALGQVTTLHYDSNGNLTRLQGPAGSGQDVQYAYNARGDVTQVTDSRGNVTQYSYDSQGNRIREQDAAGTVIERDYNASNQLIRQTVYAVADPDGVAGPQQASQAQTSHYIYDAGQRLRFAVSPEGRVTEYRYDGYGQQSSVIQHAGTIDLASLATLNYSQDFSTGTAGLNPTLPTGIARVNGTIVFTSTQQSADYWPNLVGAHYALGATWRFEVTTPAVVSSGLFSGGIDSATHGTADYRRHRATFSNGRIYASSYTGTTSHPSRDLGPAKPNTTYVIEVVTDGSGGSSLYIYEAGQSRSQGYVDRMQWSGWTNARFAAQTYSGLGAAGGTSAPGSTNTIVLDNLSVTTPAALSALETWSAGQDQRGSQRTDYVYDARGLLRQTTGYTLITAEGLGTIASNTYYVRDAAGQVLQSIDAWGMNALSSSSNADLLYQQDSAGRLTGVVFDKVTGQVKNVSARDTVVNHLTTYIYDGLGRLIYKALPSGLGQAGYAEQTLYDGANRRVTVVQSDGLRRVSAYDQRGLLVSQQEQNSTQTVLSGTSYQYDAAGRLRLSIDAAGGRTYYLYDSAGRQTGRIDAAGSLTEFIYNTAGQVVRTQRYANAVSSSMLSTLSANPSAGALTSSMLSNAMTGWSQSVEGSSSNFTNGSNLNATWMLAGETTLWLRQNGTEALNSRLDSPSLNVAAGKRYEVSAYTGAHRSTVTLAVAFYDASGNKLSEVVPSGGVTSNAAESTGGAALSGYKRLWGFATAPAGAVSARVIVRKSATTAGQTDSYAFVTHAYFAAASATQTLATPVDIRPSASGADQISRTIFDEAGRERFRIDERGYVVESRYDGAGRLIQTLAYARALTNVTSLDTLGREARPSDIALLDTAPTATQTGIHRDASNDRVTRRFYDGDGLLRAELDAVGYLTEYRYDAHGQMLQRIRHAGSTDSALRAQGSLTQLLASSAVVASAGSNLTERWIYDSLGQVTGQIDAEGYYTRHHYDANGNRIQSQRYATRADVGRLTNAVTPVTVKLRLSGTTQGGVYPQVQVKIDGTVVGTITLNSTAPKDYTLSVTGFIPGRDHNVSLVYLNDTGVVGTEDRNLFLHSYNLTTPVVVQNASWSGVQVPGNTDLTIGLWAAADGILPYGGETQTTNYGYTVRNQLASRLDADGTMNLFAYDALGRMVSSSTGWTLSNGRTGSLVATDVRGQQQRYDLQGRLTGELSALGVAALEALGASPTQAQIDAVWAAYGTRHEYDAAGRRTRTTDANGNQTLFFYDAMGRITYAVRRVRNPANANEWVGEASKREYNALGQLTRERQLATYLSASKMAVLTGGAEGQLIDDDETIEESDGPAETNEDRVVDYTYHLTGQVKDTKTYLDAVTGQTQTVTDYYTGFGQLQSRYSQQVAGRSRQDQFSYDRRGLLTWSRQDAQWGDSTSGSGANANAYVISQGFDAFGRLGSRIDARGVTERYGYDKLGRQIAVRTDPDNGTGDPELNRLRQLAFDAFDRVFKQTDALGRETLYSYDTANRTVTVTTPEGIVTKTTRNRHGEVITLVDGLGNETRYGYDKNGNLVSQKRWDKIANVETTVATHGYDTAGLLKLSETDANGNVVAYTYDAAGRMLTRRVDPTGLDLTTTYQYDAKGQAVKVTDANGNVTQTIFDRSGRVIEVVQDPLNGSAGLNLRTRYEYDLAGHVLTLTEGYGTAEARRTIYEYDNLGRRLKQVVDPDAAGYTGLKLTTTWTYDGNDNVVARNDGVGTPEVRTTRYTYDALNRLTDTIDALGGVTRNEYDLEGRVVRTTAYAQAISLAGFATPTAHTLPAVTLLLNQTDPNNRVTRSAYDKDGRLRFVIDALGAVTERQYDAAGNLKVQVRYANALAGTLAANTLPQIVSSAASSGAWVVTSTADRKSTYTYDAFNRLIEKRDGVGATDPNNASTSIETTESWAYDKVGNVIRHTDVRGQREWFAYDKANRIKRHIDQAGYVTDTSYSANQYAKLRYKDSVGVSATDDDWAQAGHAPAPTQLLYLSWVSVDRANRKSGDATISFVSGTAPSFRAYVYDALGRLRLEKREGGQIISRTYDRADRLTSETIAQDSAAAATTQYGYDALGNQTRIIDARGVALAESDGDWARAERRRLGYVDAQGNGRLAANLTEPERSALRALYTTTQQFDTTGRKLAVTDALGATTRTDYNALGDIVQITDALGNKGYFYTDALGRVTLQVGPDGAVTRTTFDTLGNQTATRRYAARVVGTLTAGIRPQIVASASGVTGPYVLESSADAQQTAVFDALGRTSTLTTWYGTGTADRYTETFSYDAAGNVLTATARNGAVTTYQYDALGRKTREVLPVTSKNASGQSVAVENRYAYDSEGHLTQKIEAYGLPEQRTTTYVYDGLGRQVSQSGDALTVFDPVTQTSSTVTPTSTRRYDLAGNLLEEVDAAGARTLHFYDAANREIGRVDALGYYTAWTYDPAGNKVGETRYTNAVSTSGSAVLGTGSAIQVLTAAPAAGTNAVYVLANADQDRAITYRYDSHGRQIETRIADLEYGLYTQGSYQSRIGDAVTRTEYDALGNVIRQTDANGNVTRSYYNAAGQKVGQLDAAGYLTVWTFDARGNTTKQTRYANAVANWSSSSEAQRNLLTLAGMSAGLANATQDRVTDYSFDALGRLLSETVRGVNAGTLDANGVLQTATVAHAVTTYTYNGLDKVTSRTDATNARTDWTYDGIGRVTRVEKPQFADFENALVRPTTDTEYDGLNNVVREIQRGKNNASETDDRITQYEYGAGGYLKKETDPTGAVTEYAIDVMGRITREVLRNRLNAAGTVSTDDVKRYRYDLMGRQTHTIDGGTYNSVVRGTGYINESGYNGFGDVTGRRSYVGTAPAEWQEFAKYDKAGRIWKTNSGDGITKVHVHDADGNTTLTITGPEITVQLTRTQALAQTGSYTINVYDERNQLVKTIQPANTAQGSAASVVTVGQQSGSALVSESQIQQVMLGQTTAQVLSPNNDLTVGASNSLASYVLTFKRDLEPAYWNKYLMSWVLNIGGIPDTSSLGNGRLRLNVEWTHGYDNWDHPNPMTFQSDLVFDSTSSTARVVTPRLYAEDKRAYIDSDDDPHGYFRVIGLQKEIEGLGWVTLSTSRSQLICLNHASDYGYTNQSTNNALTTRRSPYQLNTVTTSMTGLSSISNSVKITTPPNAAKVLIYYRESGSLGGYTALIAQKMKNSAGADISGLFSFDTSGLSRKNYEIQYVAIMSDGGIISQASGQLDLRTTGQVQVSLNAGAAFQESRAIALTGGGFHILGHQSATSIRLKYRIKGSGAQWSSTTLTGSTDTVSSGVFRAGSTTFSAGQQYEITLESINSLGQIFRQFHTEFSTTTGSERIAALADVGPIVVKFIDQPTASKLEVRYRLQNSTGSYSSIWLDSAATQPGGFSWDASSLVADRQGTYVYEVETLAYDRDSGVLINHNRSTVTLGVGARIENISRVPVKVLRFPVESAAASNIEFGFRLKGTNGVYVSASVSRYVSGAFDEFRVHLPETVLSEVEYEYRYSVINSAGTVLSVEDGGFLLRSAASEVYSLEWVLTDGEEQTTQITRTQHHNAFGEVITEIDGLGRTTNFEYNRAGGLILKREAEADVTLLNGSKVRQRPETRYTYDAAGRLIEIKDANNNPNSQIWLTGADDDSQIALKRQADGWIERQRFDVFGQLRQHVNQRWTNGSEAPYRTDYVYDKAGRLVEILRPERAALSPGNSSTSAVRARDVYVYDAAGQRIRFTDALGKTAYTDYDSLGRVSRSVSAGGSETTYAYTWDGTIQGLGGASSGGWLKIETDAMQRTLKDRVDLYGRVRSHEDLGGHQFAYNYNAAGWLMSQTGTSGQNIEYSYYANGFLRSIWDKALGMHTQYRYDDEGNKVFEGYTRLNDASNLSSGVSTYYQYSEIEYDELNRIKRIVDPKATISYEYDAVGNRRRVHSVYHDGLNGGMSEQDYWYAYDAMNRFTITMGALGTQSGETTVVAGGKGVTISYNAAGWRIGALNASDGTQEVYSYTSDGYLEQVNINGTRRSLRETDLLGRVWRYREFASNGTTETSRRTVNRDDDSRVQSESGNNNGDTYSSTYYYYVDGADSSYSQSGKGALARVSTSSTPAGGSTTQTNTYYSYEYWDEAKQQTITERAYNATLKHQNNLWKPGQAYLSYDENGHLKTARDAGNDGYIETADDRVMRYTTDAQGLVLTRDELEGGSIHKVQRYYYVDGRRVGDVGTTGPDRVDYAQALTKKRTNQTSYKRWVPISSADFDQNYEPVGPEYPGPTSSNYTVRNGDTLESIARGVWGDASLWYLIADANGLTGREALAANTVLVIPNKVTNVHNNSTTFRPYNPAEAMGDVNPTLPEAPPPPRKKKKCGGLGIIIVAVVAVVATLATAGALAPAAASASGGLLSAGATAIGTAFTAGGIGFTGLAIAGAVGSIAGQLAGMAIGVQDKFSWGAVATSALTTALAPQITPFGKGGESWAIAGNAAARSVVNQGINIVAGQQKGFSWAGVAASAIAAPVMHKVGNALFGKSDEFGNRTEQWTKDSPLVAAAAESTVNALISATTHIAIVGGKVQWAAIAADSLAGLVQSRAFGNALGNSAVDVIQAGESKSLLPAMVLSPQEQIDKAQQINASFDQLVQQFGGDTSKIPQSDLLPFAEYLKNNNQSYEGGFPLTTVASAYDGPTAQIISELKKNTAIATGYVGGLFQGVGDSIIGLGGLLKDALQTNLYIASNGRFGSQESYNNMLALGAAVANFAANPIDTLSEGLAYRAVQVRDNLDAAQSSGKFGDWFLYGASVGRMTFDAMSLVGGVAGIGKGAGSLASAFAQRTVAATGAETATASWMATPGKVGGFTRITTPWERNVWQRADIDWSLTRPDGMTNLEAASQGLAPMRRFGEKFEKVELHHLNQNPEGSLAEVFASTHRQVNHNVPPPSWRVTDPAANAAFRREVPAYWRWRANQISVGGR